MNNIIDFEMQEFAWNTTVGPSLGMTFKEVCELNRKCRLAKQIIARLEADGKPLKKYPPRSLY